MLTLKRIGNFFSSTPFLLFLIILSASYFRLANLNLIEFKSDEALNILLAAQPIFGHPFLSGGSVSSLGILNPPIFNYILFPIILISTDPRFISLFIALANVAAIIGFFLLIKKYYSLTTALIASLLISFSPWAILYSRKIWMQDLLMPFSILMLYSVHKLIIDKKEKYFALYAFSSLILIQLHPVTLIFVLITTAFILKKTKINLKYILLGAFLGIIPFIPYIIFEIQNKCPDCYSLISSRGRLNTGYSLQALLRPFQIVGIGDFRFILGDDTLTFAQKFPLFYKARTILYVEYPLLPLGFIFFMWKNRKFSFLGYATIFTTLAYFFLKLEPFMHYYIILLPLLFLFLASAFDYFIKNKNTLLKLVALFVLVLILMSSILFNSAFFALVKSLGSIKGDYGSTYIIYQNNQKFFDKYKKSPDYTEKVLSSYIPLSYMYGYQPLGKMLYGNVSTNEIPILEKNIQKDPLDKISQFKILAFYTKTPEDPQAISILRAKSLQTTQYIPIYKEVLNHYMGLRFKKEYLSSRFSFFYPEHWTTKEESDGTIILAGDGYEMSIKDLGLNNMEITCAAIKNICNKGTISEIKSSIEPL